MATAAEVQVIIDAARAAADASIQQVDGLVDRGESAAQYGTIIPDRVLAFNDYPAEYPVPADSTPGADIALFNSLTKQLQDLAKNEVANFLLTYFPNTCMYSEAEDWICSAIRDGGTGMDPAIEDAIWQRDRDRLGKDAQMMQEEMTEKWASRGFNLPSGFLLYNEQKVLSDYYDKTSAASRDVAIKQAEIEIQNIRFAVEQGLRYRQQAIQAALEYIKAVILGSLDASVRLSLDRDNAKASLISASAAYYNARTNAKQLALQVAVEQYRQLQRNDELFIQQAANAARTRVAAVEAGARAAGQTAAAALSSINAIGQLVNNE